ncbi:MAG: hypothetical protein RSB82_03285 [Victivallaceae bacterium]
MRINVKKCLFVGNILDKKEFLETYFDLGSVEFVSDKHVSGFSEKIGDGLQALKILKQNFSRRDPDWNFDETYFCIEDDKCSATDIIQETLSLNIRKHTVRDELKTLGNEILRVQPLGNFVSSHLRELEDITGMRVRFFCHKRREGKDPIADCENVFHLSYVAGFDYYLVLGNIDLPLKMFIEIAAPLSAGELYEKTLILKRELLEISDRLLQLTGAHDLISKFLRDEYNKKTLNEALEFGNLELDGNLFAIEGWVPEDKLDEVFHTAYGLGVYVEKVEIGKEDSPPVYLENTGVSRIGEDLALIYESPGATDLDPSTWIFFSFAVFFSMIINDAGYGLVFLSAALLMKFKTRKKKSTSKFKRFLCLFSYLGIGCIVWGMMTTSFFGLSFSAVNPLKRFSLTHILAVKKAEYFIKSKPVSYKELIQEFPILQGVAESKVLLTRVQSHAGSIETKDIVYDRFVDNVLMEISLFVGAIHIMMGMIRYRNFNLASLGWVFFIMGGYLYFPVYLHAVSLIHYLFKVPYVLGGQIGLILMGTGILWAVSVAVIKDKIRGLGELTQVIQVFSDVLSYLRIYALGLAGAMMGATFNKMGAGMIAPLGFMVILSGHCINIILSLMGGVIHGLRLNFIEWYHYSFIGGGKLFRPFVKVTSPD